MVFNMSADQQQVKTISHHMFSHKPNYMMDEYKRTMAKPYGYLLVDLKPEKLEHDRLKTDILPAERKKDNDIVRDVRQKMHMSGPGKHDSRPTTGDQNV